MTLKRSNLPTKNVYVYFIPFWVVGLEKSEKTKEKFKFNTFKYNKILEYRDIYGLHPLIDNTNSVDLDNVVEIYTVIENDYNIEIYITLKPGSGNLIYGTYQQRKLFLEQVLDTLLSKYKPYEFNDHPDHSFRAMVYDYLKLSQ